jgi:aryl-alcohol dehydrogenase-like predicted oxidoreductase
VGETFAGVDYETGLAAVERLRAILPGSAPMSSWALRWILMDAAVSTVIPGARTDEHAVANARACDLAALRPEVMGAIADLYRAQISPQVHQRW